MAHSVDQFGKALVAAELMSADDVKSYWSGIPSAERPKEGETFQSLNTDMKLYYHRIGTPQSDDVLVYQRPDQPKWTIGGSVTE